MSGSNSASLVRATVLTGSSLLICASTLLGAYFGYQTGAHHHVILGLIFGAAALGGELLKPFAVAGAIEALKRLDVLRGLACLVVGLVCIAYSLASELALSAGSRGDLAASREAQADTTHAAKERRQRAVTELAALKTTRPIAELEALVAASKAEWRRGCRVHVDNGVRQTVCPPNPALTAELGRAKRRAELEATIATAETAMQSAPAAVKNADPLASAVAYYLASAGMNTSAERLSPWLYLVPVIFLEIGSAFGLVVAGVFGSEPPRKPSKTANVMELDGADAHQDTASRPGRVSASTGQPADTQLFGRTRHERTAGTLEADTRADASIAKAPDSPVEADAPTARKADTSAQSASAVRLLSFIRDRGGVLVGGQRAMADAMGLSKTRLNEALWELARAGRVRLDTRSTGTVVRLVEAA
jgi:hypothetical protein